jgi:hypothetical protein
MPTYYSSWKAYLLKLVLPFFGLAAVCFLNAFLIHKVFSVPWSRYFTLYVSAGAFIGLAQVAFAISWQALDRNADLVSANPLKYVAACLWLVGLPFVAYGGHLKFSDHKVVNPWDIIASIPLIALFVLASFAWLILIAPPQYFLFLLCGAPSRVAINSNYRLRAELDDNTLKFVEPDPRARPLTIGWDASMGDKPVTMANAFGAAVLFILGQLINPS